MQNEINELRIQKVFIEKLIEWCDWQKEYHVQRDDDDKYPQTEEVQKMCREALQECITVKNFCNSIKVNFCQYGSNQKRCSTRLLAFDDIKILHVLISF